MDTVMVHDFTDSIGDRHVVVSGRDKDVDGSDDGLLRQLPNVKLLISFLKRHRANSPRGLRRRHQRQ